ncbi:MBL fold metallo-hydrolase [Luteimonas sp. XNQY3]|nr:MBL fold metallo-hydrolase [Luteimonas sp. XNQY3]
MIQDCFRKPTPVAAVAAHDLPANSITWLTHACFIISIGDRLILTDPVLSQRVGPRLAGMILGPKRYLDAPISAAALPLLDLVIISHAHFDHLDLETLSKIRARHTICPVGVADLLSTFVNLGEVRELCNDGSSLSLGATFEDSLEVRAFPVRHPGSRWRHDSKRQCNGYMFDGGSYRFHFIGDTAYSAHFAHLDSCVVGSDFAILPIGGYNPFQHNHCTPEQARDIAQFLRTSCIVPSQHATFRLSSEPLHEPLQRLCAGSSGEEKPRVYVTTPGIPVGLAELTSA